MLAFAATNSVRKIRMRRERWIGDRRFGVNYFDGEYLHADPFKRLD